MRQYVVTAEIDELAVGDDGEYWVARAVPDGYPVVVLAKYHGRVRMSSSGAFELREAREDAMRPSCPELRKGVQIRCSLIGHDGKTTAGPWVTQEEVNNAVRQMTGPLSPRTQVRLVRFEKRWSGATHGWTEAKELRQFDGALADLCKLHPVIPASLRPSEDQHLRVWYKFYTLTHNDGWQETFDPRWRMRREDLNDQ